MLTSILKKIAEAISIIPLGITENKPKKRKKKCLKRVVNKVTFVGEDFTRKNPKFER